MFQNNPLLAQLKQQLHEQVEHTEGIVKKNVKGYAFLETENSTNYFIPPAFAKLFFEGDKIAGIIKKNAQNKAFLEPETLISSALTQFTAQVIIENNHYFILLNHPFCHEKIRCYCADHLKSCLQNGDFVLAELKKHPFTHKHCLAEIVDFIAHQNTPFATHLLTVANHHLPTTAPNIKLPLPTTEMQPDLPRVDFSDYPFLTIDNEDTLDIDDALYIEKHNDNSYTLYVAIADPSAYFDENSEIDQIAKQRFYTQYLPKQTIPIFPFEISTSLCTLNTEKKRPALVCKITILSDGALSNEQEFLLAYVHPKTTLMYDQVSDYLENSGNWQPDNEKISTQLHLLNELVLLRREHRQNSAFVLSEHVDYRFTFDKNEHVTDIKMKERRSANHIIEECMIASNLCAAQFLKRHLGFGIFTTHQGFDQHLLKPLIRLLTEFELHYSAEELSTLDGYIRFKNVLSTLNNAYLNSRLRRFQAYANMQIEPTEHFGLGLPVYATWTSPLRKYSDLINHRLIKSVILNQTPNVPSQTLLDDMFECRKKQRICHRDIMNMLYFDYFSAHINAIFDGEIFDINRGGIRIRLTKTGSLVFCPYLKTCNNKNDIVFQVEKGAFTIKETFHFKQGDQVKVQIIELNDQNLAVIGKLMFES